MLQRKRPDAPRIAAACLVVAVALGLAPVAKSAAMDGTGIQLAQYYPYGSPPPGYYGYPGYSAYYGYPSGYAYPAPYVAYPGYYGYPGYYYGPRRHYYYRYPG